MIKLKYFKNILNSIIKSVLNIYFMAKILNIPIKLKISCKKDSKKMKKQLYITLFQEQKPVE